MFLREPNVNYLKLYGIICLNVARPRFFKERKYQFYKIRFIYLEKFSEKSNTEGGCLTYLAQETTSQWEQNKFTVKKSGTRPCPMQISDLAVILCFSVDANVLQYTVECTLSFQQCCGANLFWPGSRGQYLPICSAESLFGNI